jgi:hypothetical protein
LKLVKDENVDLLAESAMWQTGGWNISLNVHNVSDVRQISMHTL